MNEKIYLILKKLKTILESFKVDDKNWKTAVKFMANNIHGSKQAALKKLDESKFWSKTVKKEIVNAIDPTAVVTN
jgi:argonaute-like protein implicated in RNA metabolism and viral defense